MTTTTTMLTTTLTHDNADDDANDARECMSNGLRAKPDGRDGLMDELSIHLENGIMNGLSIDLEVILQISTRSD